MAGTYPDAPGSRIAYDRDGSGVFIVYGGGGISEAALATKQKLNAEGTAGGDAPFSPFNGDRVCVIFPRLMDLKGYFLRGSMFAMSPAAGEVSTDTTNGQDGTWTSFGTWSQSGATIPAYRSAIVALNRPGVRGIRFGYSGGGNGNLYNLHLYGEVTNPSNRVAFWRPVDDAPIEGHHLDWGDRPRATVATKTFRVKNLSSTLAAHATVISAEALTDQTTPSSLVSRHTFRYPAGSGTYAPTVTLPSLNPGEISGLIEVKQDLLSTQAVGLWSQRLLAIPGNWT